MRRSKSGGTHLGKGFRVPGCDGIASCPRHTVDQTIPSSVGSSSRFLQHQALFDARANLEVHITSRTLNVISETFRWRHKWDRS